MWFSALQITIVGMGITFFFLVFLVLAVNLLSVVTLKFFPEKPAVPEQPVVNDNFVAAVVAAIASRN
ncbi:MAG: OadG family protein [Candidatus Margulisbacteria bacterium]|jgi:oxaloacetate decarboxylase gamma subunit|nr:OadG family protein [Candidatus Margulisiibacteriota bacterium]